MTHPHAAHAHPARAQELYDEHLETVFCRRDRVLAWLLGVQWGFAVVLALVLSPYGWSGKVHATHLHVYYAFLYGGVLTLPPIVFTVLRPGQALTRHVIAVAQMMWSALFIHLTGGRIETHFHVFGSLAFLAFYRDWTVLMTATLVVAGDHLLRGLLWPESVYGIPNPEWWRFLEHAGWVAFEDVVLVMSIVETRREMRTLAQRQADTEELNATIEHRVTLRTQELASSREQYRALLETTRAVPWQWERATRRFTYVGPQAQALLGCPVDDWLRPGFLEERVHPDDGPSIRARWSKEAAGRDEVELEYRLRKDDGSWRWVRSIVGGGRRPGDAHVRGLLFDITERRELELELRQAQKLESVGRLASGVAHEINTPVQFVSDSVHFVRDAFRDLAELLPRYEELRTAVEDGRATPSLAQGVAEAEQEADVEYLLENVPKAIERSLEGLERVATIVRSMKEFAHPDQKEMTPIDLNQAIQSTLTIARNEYKYVADLETDFGELPSVTCLGGEVNQVVLNIVVNAAHAIGDVVKNSGAKGRITVRTRRAGEHVVISIGDTGGGIPPAIRERIFEPFFTTKEVGKGTGQGLAIARSVVIEKHGGELSFETELGKGTTFFIRLPIAGKPAETLGAAA